MPWKKTRQPASIILIRVNFIELWLALMVFLQFRYTIKGALLFNCKKIHCHLWSSLLDMFCLIYVCNFHDQTIPMWIACVIEYWIFKQCEKGWNYSRWAKQESDHCPFLFYSTQMYVDFLRITFPKVAKCV